MTAVPKIAWISNETIDEFTDIKKCSVSVGSYYTTDSVYTVNNHFYPYIEIVNGDLRLGVKSGGRYLIPVGDVQLRIDDNQSWSINSSETPIDYAPQGAVNYMEDYAKNLPEEKRVLLQETYKATMQTTARAMSPFTATTGDKARTILKQMQSGKKIKYRTVGLNQTGSTTGEYQLGPSLNEALNKCGIKV